MALAAASWAVGGAAAAPVADDGREIRQALADAIQANADPKTLRAILDRLIRSGGRDNIDSVLKILPRVPPSNDSTYWTLIEGACSFVDREALAQLGDAIARGVKSALSRDLIYGLSGNHSPHLIDAVGPVLRRGPVDIKLLAVPKLRGVPTPECVDLLLDLLEEEEKHAENPDKSDLLWAVLDALEGVTGERFGPNSTNWRGWWMKNRDTARLGRRARDGESGGTGTVVDSLEKDRKEEFFGLEKAPKKGVIVLSARYEKPIDRDLNNDRIEYVLSRMGVPHEVVLRQNFLEYDLRETGAIVINCAQFHRFCICPTCVPGGDKSNRLFKCTNCNRHEEFSAELGAEAIKKIKDFVSRGGHVFGEDWIIKEVIEKAYPKYVVTGDVLLKKDVPDVDVVPARGLVAHPYLRGIFERPEPEEDLIDEGDGDAGDDDEGGGGTTVVRKKPDPEPSDAELLDVKHRWAVDDESWAFKVLDSNRVLVLMSSGELQRKVEGQGAVAFAFRPGDVAESVGARTPRNARGRPRPGVVLQVLSHFGRQGSMRDEHLLQNLLLNFLIDANVERERRAGK